MSVVVLIPVLSRPHLVEPLVANLLTSTELELRILFLCSEGDDEEIEAVKRTASDYLTLDAPPAQGQYAKKINLGYRESDEEWLFLGADDVEFGRGWLETAMEYGDKGLHVIGTNDLANAYVKQGLLATHSLIRRSYADDPGASLDGSGVIYHEGYSHNFVDVELSVIARARGVFGYAQHCIVKHNHPLFRKAVNDPTYAVGLKDFDSDRALLCSRLGHVYPGDRLVRRFVEAEQMLSRKEMRRRRR